TLIPASVLAVILGLQAGAFAVVVETSASGIARLPFKAFLLVMQPIHLAIGLAEGIITAAVLCAVHRARPEILDAASAQRPGSLKKLLAVFAALTVLAGGGLSLFASTQPDGLEWAVEKTAGEEELEGGTPVHAAAAGIVESTAFMPDYAFPGQESTSAAAGILGSAITLVLAAGAGFVIHAARNRRKKRAGNSA
ncbi:MAG: energy-coupling factor ABC transporter permease, partial [Spirochaetaceae bacterium]|nr:energy-coupling factor ABC transporter permease [Spirochaetaceae bacterium]